MRGRHCILAMRTERAIEERTPSMSGPTSTSTICERALTSFLSNLARMPLVTNSAEFTPQAQQSLPRLAVLVGPRPLDQVLERPGAARP